MSPTLQAYTAGANIFNIVFRDQSFAGLWVGNSEPGSMGGAEHDQNKYVQLTFENTGNYGITMNLSMLDKWLLLHCDFRGQKKAGVRIAFQNVMKGSMVSCRFEDIDGPGFDISGGNPEISYVPSLFFVDQCEFSECGNANEPAVDLGYCTLSSIARTRIAGKKPVATGLRAAAQHYEDVIIEVKTAAEGAPVLDLRAVRDITTSRANGHVLRNVTTNGPIAFIKDPNANPARYDATLEKLKAQRTEYAKRTGEPVRPVDPVDFDQNPRLHERPTANRWNHPFLFYRCKFGDTQHAYTLINADTANGKVVTSVKLQ
ncbi:MAG: hypothetical protein ABI680_14650 [Chthoniobacteraceae bacterium]